MAGCLREAAPGLRALRLSPDAAGTDVTRLFEMPDRPIVLDALRRCRTRDGSVDALLRLERGQRGSRASPPRSPPAGTAR